jgi:hypothetical protein
LTEDGKNLKEDIENFERRLKEIKINKPLNIKKVSLLNKFALF